MGKTNRCNIQEDVIVKAEIVKKYKNTFSPVTSKDHLTRFFPRISFFSPFFSLTS